MIITWFLGFYMSRVVQHVQISAINIVRMPIDSCWLVPQLSPSCQSWNEFKAWCRPLDVWRGSPIRKQFLKENIRWGIVLSFNTWWFWCIQWHFVSNMFASLADFAIKAIWWQLKSIGWKSWSIYSKIVTLNLKFDRPMFSELGLLSSVPDLPSHWGWYGCTLPRGIRFMGSEPMTV